MQIYQLKLIFTHVIMQKYFIRHRVLSQKWNIIDDEEKLFRIPVIKIICHDTKNKIQLCMLTYHQALCGV